MKKMNLFVKSVLAVILLLGGSISLASAASFKMNFDRIAMVDPNSISPIHFKDNNNDFGGFIYFSNGTGDESELESDYVDEVELNVTYKCKKHLKGFYYDSERGERLWPLDSETRRKIKNDGDTLDISGGLFTLCVNEDDYNNAMNYCDNDSNVENVEDCINDVKAKFAGDNGIYGAITHEYEGQKFILVVGVNYSKSAGASWIEMNNELSPTFKRFDNKFPVGFVYDANGGIGFVGCELTGATLPLHVLDKIQDTGIEDLFEYTTPSKTGIKLKEGINLGLNCENIGSAGNSLIGLIIQGLIGMGRDTDTGILGNATDSKMQYFSSANINNATLMNYSRERAESLCRGKWISDTNNIANTESIICFEGSLDASDDKYKGRTIIVKHGDVTVSPAATEDEPYYDIFVGSGNLIIKEDSAELFVFKKDGFVSIGTRPDDFNNGVDQQINATNEGENFEYVGENVAVAALLKGNFIVNGGVKGYDGKKLVHKYFIHGKFTTKDTFDVLGKVFKWRCVDGESNESSKNYCPYSQEHPYTNAFLVVIDQNYSSPLFW